LGSSLKKENIGHYSEKILGSVCAASQPIFYTFAPVNWRTIPLIRQFWDSTRNEDYYYWNRDDDMTALVI